jgi:hypothetical protein
VSREFGLARKWPYSALYLKIVGHIHDISVRMTALLQAGTA